MSDIVTLTVGQLGTIIIMSMLAGTVVTLGLIRFVEWSERYFADAGVDRPEPWVTPDNVEPWHLTNARGMVVSDSFTDHDDWQPTHIYFDGARTDYPAPADQPAPPRPISEWIDDIFARSTLSKNPPLPMTLRNREKVVAELRDLIDRGHVYHADRDIERERHRELLERINANPPRRLRDPSPHAEGGVIRPRRFDDRQPIVLSEGRLVTDPDEMERLGLTADARRVRPLDRWTVTRDNPDSPSTTPPTEDGDTAP